MKYNIHRLDKRFTYKTWFEYLIAFPERMTNSQGPLNFTRTQKWFTETYGWSAEIRQYADIYNYHTTALKYSGIKAGGIFTGQSLEIPPECNPHWSWTNGFNTRDLRIYVGSSAELAFFQLKFPLDQ
jgi:hypothetical protein